MPDSAADAAVTVHWRPACPYCATLRWRLQRLGVATTDVGIWSDRPAAEDLGAAPPSFSSRPVAVATTWLVVPVVAVSSTFDALGHPGPSWALDGVAVLAYLVVRWLRRKTPSPVGAAAGADRGPAR